MFTRYFVDASLPDSGHLHVFETLFSNGLITGSFVQFANLIPYQDGFWTFESEQELRYFLFVFGFTKEWDLYQ